ncbi:glycoside hydrolase family 9 protein [Pedobacter caeni]|uniref:Peptidoglycan/xylan/chitin deacetylase, PgdA/CDA1 family n=1 Tax=Pedobacter caeni TaxID=288992 RepID=A0A1M5MEA1_9SPHI|nr:glycoside hydrolase family 9 protein [Pedobacter caeni]SHG75043.1 Peptidoglycan/xylan/chitin deacetylase, PgdA/CDA1 family [Pedobacter caeni]
MKNKWLLCCCCGFISLILLSSHRKSFQKEKETWIRINLVGYQQESKKVAVWLSKTEKIPESFQILDKEKGKIVFSSKSVRCYGAYGPFKNSCRLNFSEFKQPGRYVIRTGDVESPELIINDEVYRHAADFALRYLRQQRSGFNPYLKDSCHTRDGYTMYGPMPDSTHIDVSGGWHDASDYLQYATTSANATYHLLAAYRDFPDVFDDGYQHNGLSGKNGQADVLDEARWGLDWLLKMHPKKDWLFHQIADDRDHSGLRLPNKDNVSYGKGAERPVYFANGQAQGLGKFKNRSNGVASIAGKFSSAFALGSGIFRRKDQKYAKLLLDKSQSAYLLGLKKLGVQQTAPNRAPYFYEEDNWSDDMELAAAMLYQETAQQKYRKQALEYAGREKVSPWMGADTARHYQWYPFHNFGHYEAIKNDPEKRELLTGYYKEGIERVWNKAKNNAFYRGIPFIWCSNNLTASFAIQSYLYVNASRDETYEEFAQANFDWLFGCNPWGTSMVYGLPEWGDTPENPHSAFSHLHNYPLDGGLVDGPVYGSIYKNLIGIKLYEEDEYAAFQSDLAVYHDDFGDYSTNEPTMDGTASLVYLLAAYDHRTLSQNPRFKTDQGAIIRGDSSKKELALVFTGHEFADGLGQIRQVLEKNHVKGSFFFTGSFYNNPGFSEDIKKIHQQGHYLGAHSNEHLLYADWKDRSHLLIDQATFEKDLKANYEAMARFGIPQTQAKFFLPPYEWYNQTISNWTKEMGLTLINYSPGTRSNADYTWPEMGTRYLGTEEIYQSIVDYEKKASLNGFMLLIHVGTDEKRKDKFYAHLERLILYLKEKGYQLVSVPDLLR